MNASAWISKTLSGAISYWYDKGQASQISQAEPMTSRSDASLYLKNDPSIIPFHDDQVNSNRDVANPLSQSQSASTSRLTRSFAKQKSVQETKPDNVSKDPFTGMGNTEAGKMSGPRSMSEAVNQSGARASSSQHTSTPMAHVYRKTDKQLYPTPTRISAPPPFRPKTDDESLKLARPRKSEPSRYASSVPVADDCFTKMGNNPERYSRLLMPMASASASTSAACNKDEVKDEVKADVEMYDGISPNPRPEIAPLPSGSGVQESASASAARNNRKSGRKKESLFRDISDILREVDNPSTPYRDKFGNLDVDKLEAAFGANAKALSSSTLTAVSRKMKGFKSNFILSPHHVAARNFMKEAEEDKSRMGGIYVVEKGFVAFFIATLRLEFWPIVSLLFVLFRSGKIEILARFMDERKALSKRGARMKPMLILCPYSATAQWEGHITSILSSKPKVLVFHSNAQGSKRMTLIMMKDLLEADIVISTYRVLSLQRTGDTGGLVQTGHRLFPGNFIQGNVLSPAAYQTSANLFGVDWGRIVLDEAEDMKGKDSRTFSACCALQGEYRWALSGTLSQDNPDQVYPLFKVLRIAPFCDEQWFRTEIRQPLRRNDSRSGRARNLMRVVWNFVAFESMGSDSSSDNESWNVGEDLEQMFSNKASLN